MEQVDLTFVRDCISQTGREKHKVLRILQALQTNYGYLPQPALELVCELTEITPADIMGVSTFYNQFRHKPAGKYMISVCVGTACHIKGAERVYDAFKRHLGISGDNDTDDQGLFTVEKVTCNDTDDQGLFTVERIACIGCCTLAPAVKIDEITYGHVAVDTVSTVVNDFLRHAETKAAHRKKQKTKDSEKPPVGEIRISLDSCCISRGCGKLHQATLQALDQTGIRATVKRVGCVGMCYQTPLLEIVLPDGKSHLYARVEPRDARSIILRHFTVQGIGRKILSTVSHTLDSILTDESDQPITRYAIDVRDQPVADFFDRQKQIATEHCAVIEPVSLDEYTERGGFEALKKCVNQMSPKEVIEQVERSGLRGRGGAGFPTGFKWTTVRQADCEKKYLICNGDEGDPGAFMDRMLMESCPYRIIEGVAIAAYAVGAAECYFYIRAEYPLAMEQMKQAIDKCYENGYIGDKPDQFKANGFSLNLKIAAGAGAFVCGEETALMASIEGRRGMPRLRPPYPAQSGLWGKPTLINNAETYALVPWILRNSGDEFAKLGTEKSKGTKVFALAGKVARGALIEVPMGITIRQIVEDIGGGIDGGKRFKAVQIGGPSGGCVPAELTDISVDYESLIAAGAIMGSGGLVVLDETDCMVDIARYFLEFTQDQSCGKCTFCRIGTKRMLDILERLCHGKGKKGDIEQLLELAEMVKKGSLCGLGKTAPNPVISTIKYFRDEYEAHIEGRCPVGKCKELIEYSVTDDCVGCTLCAQHCPVDAIGMLPYQKHEIDNEKCIRCGTCRNVCPEDAIKVE